MEYQTLMRFTMSAVLFCVSLPSPCAQTSESQASNASESWTTTTESQTSNTNPTRTTEAHRQSGNSSVDTQSVERLGPDGHYEPYLDTETESIQVNASYDAANYRAHIQGWWQRAENSVAGDGGRKAKSPRRKRESGAHNVESRSGRPSPDCAARRCRYKKDQP